jgi:hypothetical protein
VVKKCGGGEKAPPFVWFLNSEPAFRQQYSSGSDASLRIFVEQTRTSNTRNRGVLRLTKKGERKGEGKKREIEHGRILRLGHVNAQTDPVQVAATNRKVLYNTPSSYNIKEYPHERERGREREREKEREKERESTFKRSNKQKTHW